MINNGALNIIKNNRDDHFWQDNVYISLARLQGKVILKSNGKGLHLKR